MNDKNKELADLIDVALVQMNHLFDHINEDDISKIKKKFTVVCRMLYPDIHEHSVEVENFLGDANICEYQDSKTRRNIALHLLNDYNELIDIIEMIEESMNLDLIFHRTLEELSFSLIGFKNPDGIWTELSKE